jgi:hypothetical protein
MKRSATSATGVNTTGNTAETVVATVPMPPLGDNPLISGVVVDGIMNMTPGAGTTGVTMRIRRGSLTGALVGPAQVVSPTVSVPGVSSFSALDLAPVPGQPYVVTMQQAAATGAGVVNYCVATATAS